MTFSLPSSEPTTPAVPAADPTPTGPTFADLDLPEPLARAVDDLGFTVPSPIQARAVPVLLSGRDLVGVAQTGTGKTAAFGLPLLAAVDGAQRGVQALVLAPTRELALQVSEAIETFAKHLEGVQVVAVYGGAPYLPQQRALKSGAQVVVGTPGRVIDHLERGTLVLDGVRFLVLDEADEMLRMGFVEEVDRLLAATPAGRQVALFSATMPPPIRRVAEQHLSDPVEVTVSRQASTVSTVKQTYAVVPERHKTGALARVLAVTDAEATIVFVRTRDAAETVGSALIEKGIAAAYISGDVPQNEREKVVDRLRSGALDVLVATDVAARGLDVDRVGLVVNLDPPREAETYVHRIGRTGRAGRSGEALTFVTPNEQRRLQQIERMTRVPLQQVTIPTPADVSAHRADALLNRADERAAKGRLDLYRTALAAHLEQRPGLEPMELMATLLALAVDDEGPAPRPEHGDDLDDALSRVSFTPERTRGAAGPGSAERGAAARGGRRQPGGSGPRYRVAVGYRDGLAPGALVGALTGEGGLTGADIGKIDIFASFTLVDIPGGLNDAAMEKLSRTKVAGRPLQLRVDSGPRPGQGASRPAGGSEGPRHGHHDGPRHGHEGPRNGRHDGPRGANARPDERRGPRRPR